MRETRIKTPRGPRDDRSFLKGYLLPKLFFFIAGFPKDAVASVDITNRCNLRCRHCYFFAGPKGPELSDEEWVERFEAILKEGRRLRSCTWVGGEPLLRKDILRRLMNHFQFNIVVTNGSVPLPDWPDVYFHVSVDGTKEYHDKIRGEGSYEMLRANLLAEGAKHLNITLATCLMRTNAETVEPLIEEWYPVPHIRGIIFDFFTPIAGVKEDLWIPFDERDKILDRLIMIKRDRKYRDFISLPERTLHLMKSKNMHLSIGKNCIFRRKAFALDASGKLKSPCMLGAGADCSRCGCIVPFYLKSRTEKKYILQEVWGDIKCFFQ